MKRVLLLTLLAGCGGPGPRMPTPIVTVPQAGLLNVEPVDPRPAQVEGLLRGHLWRAEERINAGDAEAARAELEAARTLARFDPRVNLALGSVYRVLGENEAAHASFEMAARFAPSRFDLYWMDGELAMDEGDHERARVMLQFAEAWAPDAWRTRWLAGRLALADARYPEAVSALDDATKSDEAPMVVWSDLADALRAAGALDEARAVYLDVLDVEPDDERALAGIAAIDGE